MRVTNKQAIEINGVAAAMANTLVNPHLGYILVMLRDLTATTVAVYREMATVTDEFREYQIGADAIAKEFLTIERQRPDGGYNLPMDLRKVMQDKLNDYKSGFEPVVDAYLEQQTQIKAYLEAQFDTDLPSVSVAALPPNVTVGIIDALSPLLEPYPEMVEAPSIEGPPQFEFNAPEGGAGTPQDGVSAENPPSDPDTGW
jgi:hypothetical protein